MNAITLAARCAALCAFTTLLSGVTSADEIWSSLSAQGYDALIMVAAKTRDDDTKQHSAEDESDRSNRAGCGTKRHCKDMSSCAEARHYLNDCGAHTLDRDGDGIPCENVCKKGR